MKYPQSIEQNLRDIIKHCEDTIENLDKKSDEELNRLEWVEKDFTVRDGKTQYFAMIKLQPSNYKEEYWNYDFSDGFCRTGGSSASLEEAWDECIDHAQDNFSRNKENGWLHNNEN
jgi:flavin-binding protein dodecin